MEDENKVGTIIKIVPKIVIALIIIIIVIIIGINLYNNILTTTNTNKFQDYLNNNGYEEINGTLTKQITENEREVQYTALSNDSILSKTISFTDNGYINMNLKYHNDRSITIDFQLEGNNNNNTYGVLFQTGSLKDGTFNCEVTTGYNYTSRCDIIKQEAELFNSEVTEILENNDINPKYVS